MSTYCGKTIRREPGLTTPTLTAVLAVIALSLWLVVIPLEITAFVGRGPFWPKR
jgi:hypothetical protein